MNQCSGNINLLALIHAKYEVDGKNGKVKGIFIPIEINNLEVRDNDKIPKLNLNFSIVPTPDKDQDGFIGQQGAKQWKDCTDEEKEAIKLLPILGNVKEWGQSDGVNNQVSEETFTPTDSLPF